MRAAGGSSDPSEPDLAGHRALCKASAAGLTSWERVVVVAARHHQEEVWTGQDVADIYSRFLGREICYVGNDLEVREKKAPRTLPGSLLKRSETHVRVFSTPWASGKR
jgi:hypothetical protein